MKRVEIVAAVIRDPEGRVLLVRKQGTTAFMQPGGKKEPGEPDLDALARELHEELGCRMHRESAAFRGRFEAPAANEPGHVVAAAVYDVTVDGAPDPRREIAELRWVNPHLLPALPLAPLTRDMILPSVVRDGKSPGATAGQP